MTSQSNLNLESVESRFRERFSNAPDVVVSAPGRVNLIGEHIDYNDGWVLPFAIDRRTWIAARKADRSSGFSTFFNWDTGEHFEWKGHSPGNKEKNWADYVAGVLLESKHDSETIPPFDAQLMSDVPVGAGLSSSASLEVAVATLLEGLTGKTIDRLEKAKLCQRAEHLYAGVPCGLMDQYSVTFAKRNKLLLLDCLNLSHRQISCPDENTCFLVVNSMVKHELADSEYRTRREQCERALNKIGQSSWRDVAELNEADRNSLTQNEYKRANHVISETKRTLEFSEAIQAGDLDRAGQLMFESHESLKANFEVSCPELDRLVEAANHIGSEAGVWGARMTGGGFGGCTINLVATQKVNTIAEKIHASYLAQSGMEPQSFVVRPSAGAMIHNVDDCQKGR